MITSTQKTSYVEGDCILEDDMGAIFLHIWNPLIDQVETNKSYKFTNLTVKIILPRVNISQYIPINSCNYNHTVTSYIVCATNTRFSWKRNNCSKLQICKQVDNIFFLSSVYDLLSTSTKCSQCGTGPRMTECFHEASIKLAFSIKTMTFHSPLSQWNSLAIETNFFDTTSHYCRTYWRCNDESPRYHH